MSVLLAVSMIWLAPPYVRWLMSAGTAPLDPASPVRTIIGDGGDPTGQSWQIAWTGHALLHDIGRLWNTNLFHPEPYGLAYTDSLLGYAPFGFVGGGPDAAVLRYNVVFVLAFALAFLGGYALVRQLGGNWIGAAAAGAAFAYAPWRYGHDGHLNILSSGGIALALAMLARGHGWSFTDGYRPERTRPGWVAAGWLTAAWQISLGFGIGLPFAYVLAGVCLVAAGGWLLRGRPSLGRRVLLADAGGLLVFLGVTGYLAQIYQSVRDLHPQIERSWDYVALFSPTWKGLLTAPRPSLPWGDWHEPARQAMGNAPNEKVLLCGFLLYALAAAGLVISIWTIRQRVLLAAGIVLGVLLAIGTNGPLYKLVYLYLPGFDGTRTPGRLILWPTLLLGVLAAGLLTQLCRRAAAMTREGYARTAAQVVTVPLLAVLLFEGMPKLDHVPVRIAPAVMAEAHAPLMVLPSDEGIDLNIALWSTAGFPTMVNGAAGITTPEHHGIRELMKTFPSPQSQQKLREIGVRTVVVVREYVVGTPYELVLNAPATPGVTRRDVGADILYTLD
ncbi:hypothetical protein Ari01nite_07500 [Paractinoplanes rishiriensis]|uniref:Glycosyltransferase RgtA/B/C/D-like domain-containing protein n=2 Tax=Paractinoplanes rishiriensis TaxID=1050105 RepID=A0A919JR03_9ACTN|nr:hypothetical protein Ari01nite_07500 [Actinoplanes rishiriensis]